MILYLLSNANMTFQYQYLDIGSSDPNELES